MPTRERTLMMDNPKRENSFDDILSFAQVHAKQCGDKAAIMAAHLDELELAYVEVETELASLKEAAE